MIEEPDDQEPEGQPQEEYPQATSDLTTEEANPSEEGRQDHANPSKQIILSYAYALGLIETNCIRLPGRPGPSTYT